jgi:uncharacterized membrane protein (UPF0127 family)
LLAAFLLAVALASCKNAPVANEAAVARPRRSPAGMDVVPLTIADGGRTHDFSVEVARTPAQQERGLMFRTALGPNEGMLFPFDPPRPASFWMRNTLIPLDMIFIRADGTIARIAAGNAPRSETPVVVDEPVTAVLEIVGGRAAQLRITGGRVAWSD